MAFDGFAELLETRTGRGGGAATAAHDFNNLLGVIIAANEALARQLPQGGDARELASIALEAAEKGAELLARMMAGAERPQAAPSGQVDCAEALTAAARLANVSTATGVTCVALGLREPLACRADRGDLDSALLNLCINAGHALPRGGAVRLQADAADLDPAAAAELGVRPGRYVALSVVDDGVGMPPHVLARCADAYFTTRAGRGGTGLGLAGVAAFCRDAGGALKLASAEGRGTTATLVLPRA